MTREEAIAILDGFKHNPLFSSTHAQALDMAISALKGEWIPVSERLPEEREWYLAIFKEKDTNFHLIPRVADYIGHGENRWRLIDEEGLTQEYRDLLECVAWMPLPEPYKKGGEE
jgi:hypothetical protein